MNKLLVCILAAALVAILAGSERAEAQNCNPLELSSCQAAIGSSAPPSKECCDKLKAQKPCLCSYLKDPSLQPYIPGAKRVAKACGVAIPSCS